MRLGLDIDNVICDFTRGVFKFAGVPYQEVYRVHSYDYKEVFNFKNLWERVKDDETFWLSLPVLDSHIPSCCAAFVSARYCPPETTMRWLEKHNLAKLPLHQTKDKLQTLRNLNLQGLVDDKAEVFLEVREEFPLSFLVSRPWNRHVSTPNRIYRLEELDWRMPHA